MIDLFWFILDCIAWFMTIVSILTIGAIVLVVAGIAGLFGMYELALRGEDNGTGSDSEDNAKTE